MNDDDTGGHITRKYPTKINVSPWRKTKYIQNAGAVEHGVGPQSNDTVEDRCDWCMS